MADCMIAFQPKEFQRQVCIGRV